MQTFTGAFSTFMIAAAFARLAMNLVKILLRRQWPFWLGGLFVGLAEILFYCRYQNFIPMTTGLAQMFAVLESRLFGQDWISRVYTPGIHWIIIGTVAGSWLVAKLEGESRNWVRYDRRMLILAFIGGILFSFGTRLAAGCTTHHFLGGIPSMSIASWAVLLSGVPFAFLAFRFTTWLGLGGYLRHQESRAVASVAKCHPGWVPDYNPNRDPLRLLLLGFAFLLFFLPLAYSVFGDIQGAVSQIGWFDVTWLLASGLLLGIGIAKCGFGTECAAMAPESCFMPEESFLRQGVPGATYRMFRGMLPLQGLMSSIVVFHLFLLGSWFFFDGWIPEASADAGLYWGHLLGGPLLGMGAVFMIGCEVRTYGRLGMGYETALAALPGFYVGYLPYTMFKAQIDCLVFGQGLTEFMTIPEWCVYHLGGREVGWALVYCGLMIFVLLFSFAAARSFFQVRLRELLFSNTDELINGVKPISHRESGYRRPVKMWEPWRWPLAGFRLRTAIVDVVLQNPSSESATRSSVRSEENRAPVGTQCGSYRM